MDLDDIATHEVAESGKAQLTDRVEQDKQDGALALQIMRNGLELVNADPATHTFSLNWKKRPPYTAEEHAALLNDVASESITQMEMILRKGIKALDVISGFKILYYRDSIDIQLENGCEFQFLEHTLRRLCRPEPKEVAR